MCGRLVGGGSLCSLTFSFSCHGFIQHLQAPAAPGHFNTHRMLEPSLNCVFLVVFAAAQICELMLAHQHRQLHWWVLHHWYKLSIEKILKRKVFIIGLMIFLKKGLKKFSPSWSVFVRPTFGQSMHTSLVVPNEAI